MPGARSIIHPMCKCDRRGKTLEFVSHWSMRTAIHPNAGRVDAPTGSSLGNGVTAATSRSPPRQYAHGRVEAAPCTAHSRAGDLASVRAPLRSGWHGRVHYRHHRWQSSSLRRFGTGAADSLAPPGGEAARARHRHGSTGLPPLLHCCSSGGGMGLSHLAPCAAEESSPFRDRSSLGGARSAFVRLCDL